MLTKGNEYSHFILVYFLVVGTASGLSGQGDLFRNMIRSFIALLWLFLYFYKKVACCPITTHGMWSRVDKGCFY